MFNVVVSNESRPTFPHQRQNLESNKTKNNRTETEKSGNSISRIVREIFEDPTIRDTELKKFKIATPGVVCHGFYYFMYDCRVVMFVFISFHVSSRQDSTIFVDKPTFTRMLD